MDRLIRGIRSLTLNVNPDVRANIFELPTEVRLIIYRHLLASSDRTIFTTSKFIRNEGLPPIFYVHTGYQNSHFKVPPDARASDGVQKLRLRIFMRGDPKIGVDCNLIKYFGGSSIQRETCEILLDLGRQQPFYFLDRFADPPILLALSTLTGFKRLYIKIVPRVGLTGEWHYHKFGYEIVRQWLEGGLGPSTLNDDDENRYLVFWPWVFTHQT